MTPFVDDPDFKLFVGDALETLRTLPDGSVDCVATSPPFYALRDYGTGTWSGGDAEHEHDRIGARGGRGGSGTLDKRSADAMPSTLPARSCSCGATYSDPQIGLEDTPELWAASLVAVFAECRRVLTSTGTLWVECGDSYVSGQGGRQSAAGLMPLTTKRNVQEPWNGQKGDTTKVLTTRADGYKPKDLLGQPWMLAFALRADGWWLRQAIIWHKPNAMPESATDRCTTAHSYVFLLSKSARYHFDAEAIAEPAEWARWGDQTVPKYEGTDTASGWMKPKTKAELHDGQNRAGRRRREADHRDVRDYIATGNRTTNGANGRTDEKRGFDNRLDRADGLKNPRSVWTIPTQGYPEAHFATWPEKLVERIILAGCPEGGTVLDPFMGSGTTALVARKHSRRSVGIELNPAYAELAARRLGQQSLLAEGAA